MSDYIGHDTFLEMAENEYGTPVSRHRCHQCDSVFTVCPPHPRDFGGCQAEICPSYDPRRDADILFDMGKVKRAGGSR